MDLPPAINPSRLHIDPRTPNTQHSYGTRIRQNIVIKPSARLRQSPDPPHRKPRPAPGPKSALGDSLPHHNYPQFPPPHIVLHPDDANSKVFLAIGRSFISVDNRAMTIKDLAEMTVHFGLVCQNVSAASQAITTYIRTHMQRCEIQQDHPLLLRHVLSGTASDDDLLPALHSRSGGAHCTASPENRATNFRRGTMVWYLSRATGAPCPFSRAGIRLCDYGEDGKAGMPSALKEKKRQRDRDRRAELCGQKRKRPLRGCVAKGSESESQNDEERPPKVKLTLRLKPLYRSPIPTFSSNSGHRRIIDLSRDTDSEESQDESEDDSMSVISSDDDDASPAQRKEEPLSLPPYPRRSISIPCYTPSFDGPYPHFPSPAAEHAKDRYRRSPSVPYSVGSPPPDSEDEDDDFHITMTGVRRHSADPSRIPAANDTDFDWDADLDSEGDGETLWESPGPRSPSAPAMLNMTEVAVKEEPTDVQGMLEAWEDFDCSVADAKMVEGIIAQAAASALETESMKQVKVESLDSWIWEGKDIAPTQDWYSPTEGRTTTIKQEDFDIDTLLNPAPFQNDTHLPAGIMGSYSPISPMSQFSGLSFSDSPSSHSPATDDSREFESEWNDSGKHFATVRPRAKTLPAPFAFFTGPTPTAGSSFTLPLAPQRELSESTKALPGLAVPSVSSASQSLVSLIQTMSMNSPTSIAPSSLMLPSPCISPHETHYEGTASSDVVVVHTCQPCAPAISATQIEGISVYQMMLGSFALLRRIDTDFVNLTPIVAYSGAPCPVLSTIPNSTLITKGSPAVSGTWVPLSAAQAYVRDHPLPGGPLDTFLSDVLFEQFPSALQDFHKSSSPGRMFNHFGPHFGSTLQATQLSAQADMPSGPWDGWTQDDPLGASGGSLVLPVNLPTENHLDETQTPLSATEQEIFHALCIIPDWDKENASSSKLVLTEETASVQERPLQSEGAPEHDAPADPSSERSDRPLRRSKRVADAIAAQSRTRPRRGGSRNSLS